MRPALLSAAFVTAAVSAAAAAPKVTKAYSYSDPIFSAQDSACIAAMLNNIAPDFDGLQQVSLEANSIFQTQDGYLATYAGVRFEGHHGNAQGTLNCVFSKDGRSVTDVSVTFEGRGLGGYTRHPFERAGGDLTQQKSTAVSKSVAQGR